MGGEVKNKRRGNDQPAVESDLGSNNERGGRSEADNVDRAFLVSFSFRFGRRGEGQDCGRRDCV